MRFALSPPDCYEQVTAALNLRYFNSKKGSHWSQREKDLLLVHVLKYGPTQFKSIRHHTEGGDPPLGKWSEHEIRLRVCKLLKIYDLDCYNDHIFTSEAELKAEAQSNLA